MFVDKRAQLALGIGSLVWWSFVVSTLFAGGLTWLLSGDSYPPLFVPGSDRGQPTVKEDAAFIAAESGIRAFDLSPVEWISLGSLLLAILLAGFAALTQKGLVHRLFVLVCPVFGFVILCVATPGLIVDVQMNVFLAFVLVLASLMLGEISVVGAVCQYSGGVW